MTLQQTLFETARKVFEEAAFSFVDETECEMSEEASGTGSALAASLVFEGPFSGVLAISASEHTAGAVAANMLGIDEFGDDAGVNASDAMGEILNMICGNLLPAVAGKGPEFEIGTPVKLSLDDFERIKKEEPPSKVTYVKTYIDGWGTEIVLVVNNDPDQLT